MIEYLNVRIRARNPCSDGTVRVQRSEVRWGHNVMVSLPCGSVAMPGGNEATTQCKGPVVVRGRSSWSVRVVRLALLMPVHSRIGLRGLACRRNRICLWRQPSHRRGYVHTDLGAQAGVADQLQGVAGPELAGVVVVRRPVPGKEPHRLVGAGDHLRAVGRLHRRRSTQPATEPPAGQGRRRRERGAVRARDGTQQ